MIAWAVDTLIATSLLMLLVLAVRRPVAECFGAGWSYALWLLVLIRVFMPSIDLFGGDLPLPQRTVIYIPAASGGAAVPSAASPGTGQWLPLLLALWAGGAAVFFAWQQAAYGALMLSLGREGRRAQPPEFGGIPVVASELVDGPMAVGFVHRRIVVPLDFATRYSLAEQRLALEHELIHHRRGDLWWNLAALVMLTVNWFNPLAHLAFRAFRIDQELACDAAVAGAINADGRHDYACALVKSASRPGQIAVCPLNRADQLKRRLKMMKEHRATLGRRMGGAAAVSALVLGGLVVAGPGLAQEEVAAPARVLVADRGARSPIISDADIKTLRDKCGESSVTVNSDGKPGRNLVCGNGRVVKDPEVNRIVDKALERAETEVKRAEIDVGKAEAIARSVERAQAQIRRVEIIKPVDARAAIARANAHVRHIEVRTQMQAARKAMAHAATQLAHADVQALRAVAAVRAAPVIRIKLSEVGMSAEDRAELEADLAEMREDLRREQADLQRELRDAELERQQALREADQARNEALREAEQARRDALREAEQARRHALRDAQRAIAQARRDAERERLHAIRDAERETERSRTN